MVALPASATMITFDFENDGSWSSLDQYMSSTMGRSVDAGDANWLSNSNTFGSGAIFTQGYSSTLNFDTAGDGANGFEITALAFEWGTPDASRGSWSRDFGLDVYDDRTQRWYTNVFDVWTASDGDTGQSGLIQFVDWAEVTRLRFHDNNTYDVGLDNLTIWDNRADNTPVAVPEPGTLALLGTGILLLGLRRRRPA